MAGWLVTCNSYSNFSTGWGLLYPKRNPDGLNKPVFTVNQAGIVTDIPIGEGGGLWPMVAEEKGDFPHKLVEFNEKTGTLVVGYVGKATIHITTPSPESYCKKAPSKGALKFTN